MPVTNRIAGLRDEMAGWRRHLHAHPETAYEEVATSDFVAARLREFGVEVHQGLARTGVVGVLRAGSSPRCIGLRADMDALCMEEKNAFSHASRHPGRMHACGHDGHTAMLLGAARYLAETRRFDGTINVIFQPAEEGGAGARVMLEEGLFETFPCETVFGMHNWPQVPAGKIAVRVGPVMAAADHFDILVEGRGAHGAMPHHGVDPVLVAAHIVTAAQSLVSRGTDPLDSAVVSFTVIRGGSAFNIIPADVTLSGTVRSFLGTTQNRLEEQLARMAESIATAFGARATVSYERCYPPTVNTEAEARMAQAAAERVVGEGNVLWNIDPSMGAEDFAFMLEKRPGCYIWLGQGDQDHPAMVHNPNYDFNDEVLTIGASYWATLAELALPV